MSKAIMFTVDVLMSDDRWERNYVPIRAEYADERRCSWSAHPHWYKIISERKVMCDTYGRVVRNGWC